MVPIDRPAPASTSAVRQSGRVSDVAETVPGEWELLGFLGVIASRDGVEFARMLSAAPGLAVAVVRSGATRQDPNTYFLEQILHHVYAGDTALHIAGAAFQRAMAESLVAQGADVGARNRRGAQPLHYAADGNAAGFDADGVAQRSVIEYLISVGADPDVCDKSGVAPLHRAVRTRATSAVAALLDGGADLRLGNRQGSTPLHLAVQNTGASNSGTADAKDRQREIITLLLQHGANPTDTDANGKPVTAAATSNGIRELLDKH